MLTVRYDRLGLRPGDRVLDLGCGAGRHAFEAARRGATVVAADLDLGALAGVRATGAAMAEAGQLPLRGALAVAGADALTLPFPDAAFDRVVASEVMEHIADDGAAAAELLRVLRPGGTIAVTVPSWLPERLCWALSEEYHAPHVAGGHVRVYTREAVTAVLRGAGFEATGFHRAHALHSPYWWLRCAVGPADDGHPLVRAYHRLLVWDMVRAPAATRLAERALEPVLGKSLVVYATRPEPAAGARRAAA